MIRADRNGVQKTIMCKMLEDMRNEAAKESVRKTAKRLLKMEKLLVLLEILELYLKLVIKRHVMNIYLIK